jgi:2-methylisocitrate lyase-like PEP mutase family enzyme
MPGKVEILRKLHQGPPILVLPNAWDVASARIFEAAGFPAIATTSAGVANSLGYPDVERIPRDEMIWMVRRIARSVSVPVTLWRSGWNGARGAECGSGGNESGRLFD